MIANTIPLISEWEEFGTLPGTHVVLFSDTSACVTVRNAEWHLRDTILILHPGPRIEYAFLFRKALKGTVIRNILRDGTGALNIDACRIGTTTQTHSSAPKSPRNSLNKGMVIGTTAQDHSYGRWPSNLILVHGNDCTRLGTRKIPGHKGYPNGPGGKSYQYSSNKRGSEVRPNAWAGHADADGLETIDNWQCAPNCPVSLLDAQSGNRPSTLTGRADPNQVFDNPGDNRGSSWFGGGNSRVYADSGGASRFYPQVANSEELKAWLTRLVSAVEFVEQIE